MKNKKARYDLTFNEILERIFDGGSFQGENFRDGVFITYDKFCETVVMKCFGDESLFAKTDGNLFLYKGLVNQKFREVFTRNEILRR